MISKLHDFLYMSGYGYYVFSSYGLVMAMLAIQWFLPWRRWRHYKQEQEKYEPNT